MRESKAELKKIIVKYNNGKKFITVSIGRPKNKFPVVEQSKVQGKTGNEIAKHLGLNSISDTKDFEIHLLSKWPKADAFDLPSKSMSSAPIFLINKSPGTKKIGLLRGDEKLTRAPRQKTSDKPIDNISPLSGEKPADKNTIELYQKTRLIELWIKNRLTLARVLSVSRPKSEAKYGYFTDLRSIKGKTLSQMEGRNGPLGVKEGYFAAGALVFTLDPKKLAPRDFEMRGYSHLPGGKPTNFEGLTPTEVQYELNMMTYPPGTGALQIEVKNPKTVKLITRKPLSRDDKL